MKTKKNFKMYEHIQEIIVLLDLRITRWVWISSIDRGTCCAGFAGERECEAFASPFNPLARNVGFP